MRLNIYRIKNYFKSCNKCLKDIFLLIYFTLPYNQELRVACSFIYLLLWTFYIIYNNNSIETFLTINGDNRLDTSALNYSSIDL